MKASRMIMMVVFICIALCLAGILVIGLSSGKKDFGVSFGFFGGEEVIEEYEITENVESLDIRWDSSEITVKPHNLDIVKIKHTRTSRMKAVKYEISNGLLSIQQPRIITIGLFINSKSILEVYLPQKQYEKLKIKISSGSADISDLEVNELDIRVSSGKINVEKVKSENVTCDISSGNVNLDKVSAAEKFFIDVSSGKIVGTGLSAKSITSEVTSGSTSLEGEFENVDFDTTSGKVYITNHIVPDTMTGKITSGTVNVSIPDNDGFNVQYTKTSGKFNSDFDLLTSINGSIYSYKNGGNQDREYKFKVTSGVINFNKTK